MSSHYICGSITIFHSTAYNKHIQNKQSFKPHSIYLFNSSLRDISQFPSPTPIFHYYEQLRNKLNAFLEHHFRILFWYICILSFRKLHSSQYTFPWKYSNILKPGLVNKGGIISGHTCCDWWRKFLGVPSIICFFEGNTRKRKGNRLIQADPFVLISNFLLMWSIYTKSE